MCSREGSLNNSLRCQHSCLTLEVSGRCHSGRQITVVRRSGPLDRIVSFATHNKWPTRRRLEAWSRRLQRQETTQLQ